MPQTPALSYYLGPAAVYPSPTGMTDPITGIPYLGGTLHEGDYVDATISEISQWNVRFGISLNTGRYRLVRVSPNAVAANTGFGVPVGWALPTTVGQVALTAAGTGSGTGTVLCSSTTSGGTSATALVSVAAGVITGVQLVYAGANFTSVPTWGLTEITAAGITTSGMIVSQMAVSPNVISTIDSSANSLYDPRGIMLCSLTSAQITAGAWVVIQEQGIAPLLPTTASAVAAGSVAYVSATAAKVTVAAITPGTTPLYAGTLGYTLDIANANFLCRVDLALPVRQG